MEAGASGLQDLPEGRGDPAIAVEPRPLPYGSAYRRGAPPHCHGPRPPGQPLTRVVAAHLAHLARLMALRL